jgi:hypothetical protein
MIAGQLAVGRIVLAERQKFVKTGIAHVLLQNGWPPQDLPFRTAVKLWLNGPRTSRPLAG